MVTSRFQHLYASNLLAVKNVIQIVSASKVGGSSEGSDSELSEPSQSKGAARALVTAEKELQKERLRTTRTEAGPALGLPNPAERRKILERASSLIAEARSLLERLDGSEPQNSISLPQSAAKPRQTNRPGS